MSTEIPIWVNGKIRWLSGIDKKTTCKDVVEVLLEGEGVDKSEVKDFTIMERWRKVERPLDENSKILKIWSHWGNEKREVRLCLRRIDNEVDSGRGSPIGSGNTPSLRRKRNRSRGNGKPPWAHPETLHPRRLAELGRISKKDRDEYSHFLRKGKQTDENDCSDRLKDDYLYENKPFHYEDINAILSNTENVNNRKKSGHKSYHCSGTGRLHSTLLSEYSNSDNYPKRSKCCSKRESKQKVRNSENIEKLMKLILAQGATIQSQLQKLREREEQIESIEHERHRARIEKNGRNYLLETYLGSLKDAEIPVEMDEEKGNDSGVHTEGGSDQTHLAAKRDEADNGQSEPVGTRICDNGPSLLGHRREHSVTHSSTNYLPYQKTTRSRSESRMLECKQEGNLKRTLSDNAIAENEGVVTSGNDVKRDDDVEPDLKANAKEESEEVIQLRRIQSQIEMWEKVFKINKKLEKEEENLVRLHIKIKKVQSENFRIAKECSEANDNSKQQNSCKQSSETNIKTDDSPQQCTLDQDCLEVHKNLEILRSDLEQNSKEIYQNFTRLMEEDKLVEQKRNCLTQLISDLERTDQEHEMLNEMITMTERRQPDHNPSKYFCYNSETEDFGNSGDLGGVANLKNGEVKVPECNPATTEMPNTTESMNLSSNPFLLQKIQDGPNQSTETDVAQENSQQTKPKIVKISFEDQIQNFESSERGEEKLPKGPMAVASGALKGILKNRKFGYDSNLEKYNSIKEPQQNLSQVNGLHNDELDYQKSSNVRNCVQMKYPYSSDFPDRINNNSGQPYPPMPTLYNQIPNNLVRSNFSQVPSNKTSDDLKTACPVKNLYSSESPRTPANVLPHSTMVQTKVMVHNDTDSSTSSDTSGLSSMYSSSPTVEEHYVDQGYVLNTLV